MMLAQNVQKFFLSCSNIKTGLSPQSWWTKDASIQAFAIRKSSIPNFPVWCCVSFSKVGSNLIHQPFSSIPIPFHSAEVGQGPPRWQLKRLVVVIFPLVCHFLSYTIGAKVMHGFKF